VTATTTHEEQAPLCLELANTWGDRARPESDTLASYPALLELAVRHEAVPASAAAELARMASAEPAAATEALATARALRDALYRLFSACAAGRELPAADLDTLNATLAEALPYLRVGRTGDGCAWEWSEADRSLLAPLRPIARSAAELLTGELLSRVRECGGDTCTWLFLDASRNRSRRWCSMESCGNRAKAKRHYRRRRRNGDPSH
jgi:predicted RNA-binding Zn ribbon-like protein